MTNFKKPVLDNKGKPVKNLFQKDDKFGKLIKDLNKKAGISIASSVAPATLKMVGQKIRNVLPLVGTVNPRTRKKD